MTLGRQGVNKLGVNSLPTGKAFINNCLNGGILSIILVSLLRLSRINTLNLSIYILQLKSFLVNAFTFFVQLPLLLRSFVNTSQHFCITNDTEFFSFLGPGLYQIRCKVNNKRYIGEANNVLDRLAKHGRALLTNVSDCTELQRDWNLFGCNQFEATVICVGPEWASKQTRLERETQLISSYLPEEVYNSHPNTVKISQDNYRVSCEIDGIVYPSIKEASEERKEAESTIRAKLNNGFTGYKIIQKIKHGYEAIIANGRFYT